MRYLGIAYGTVAETVELLGIGLEAELLSPRLGVPAMQHATNARRLLLGLVKRRRPSSCREFSLFALPGLLFMVPPPSDESRAPGSR
jgi:hypothetical protein